MFIHLFRDQEDLCRSIASRFKEKLHSKTVNKIGLATGKTMIPLYQQFCLVLKSSEVQSVEWFMLDELMDLPPDSPDTYYAFLSQRLFKPLNIPRQNIYPLGQNPQDYQKLLEEKKYLDIQLLGIGLNGHVGLNEPGVDPQRGCHIEQLSLPSITSHLKLAQDQNHVPKAAITQGISDLMKHQELWLVALGESKKEIMKRFFDEDPSSQVPATLLKNHPALHVFMDEAAFSLARE